MIGCAKFVKLTKIAKTFGLRNVGTNSAFEVSVPLSNGKNLQISTGKYARMADGCAVVSLGDTSVMVTAVSEKKSDITTDFLPLTVDYRQKAAAAGRIPTNFLRRELGPTENEILSGRLIDRSIRPLFPKNFLNETQIICNMLALDGIHEPEVLAINGASAALAISNIPWNGPVGAARVGLIGDKFITNPTRLELSDSSLNLIVTGSENELVVMLEGSANNIPKLKFKKAIKVGLKECMNIIKSIQDLRVKCGKEKTVVQELNATQETNKALKDKLKEIFSNYTYDKAARDEAVNKLREEVMNDVNDEVFNKTAKEVFRSLVLENNIRCDGRKLEEIRPIFCQTDLFKPLHGSALFQRGQTQVICTVTLDSVDSSLKLDPVSTLASGIKEKNFFLHYEFPSYATNEITKGASKRRREIGHGALAERGIRAVLPKDYPFTIRLTSEVLESNGSSSMASVCGGSLALMDAGVPVSEHVAGVAMGLITKSDPITQQVQDYKILTDIMGIEDFLGDMDLKVAGSEKGVTAVQADIKIPGLPLDILMESLDKAAVAKTAILDKMNKTLAKPRTGEKENMPVIENINVPAQHRGKLFGSGGYNLKKVFLETGVHVNLGEDSNLSMFAPNKVAMSEAKETINKLLEEQREPSLEFGGVYTAKVVEVRESGVMITLYSTMTPVLLHNSQLDQRKINHPSAIGMSEGMEIQVKYFGRDPVSGQMRLSRKVLQSTHYGLKNLDKNKGGGEKS